MNGVCMCVADSKVTHAHTFEWEPKKNLLKYRSSNAVRQTTKSKTSSNEVHVVYMVGMAIQWITETAFYHEMINQRGQFKST